MQSIFWLENSPKAQQTIYRFLYNSKTFQKPQRPTVYLRNIKHFFRIDIQLYQHEWKLEKREIVWKHDARRAECFHTISSFSNFHEC